MLKKLKPILSTATIRQASLTSISSIANGILGAAFYFLLARWLGNVAYGQFSLVATSIATLAGVANLGTDQSLVKFSKAGIAHVKAAFVVKIVSAIVVSAVLLLVFPNWLGALLAAGILAQMLFSFSVSLSQAREDYLAWSGLLAGTNLLRLVFLVSAYPSVRFFSASLIYIFCPLAGFLVFLAVRGTSFLRPRLPISIFKEIFGFNKWITAFIIINALGSRLDLFLTAKFTNMASAGVYALATQLVAILPQLTTALGAVTAPKFASFQKSRANAAYLKKSLLFASSLAIIASFLLVVAAVAVIKFTGNDFTNSWGPFLVLLLGMDVFLATTPLRDSILYYFSDAQFFFWSGVAQIAATIIMSQLLIPVYGLLGSAAAVLSSQLLLAVLVVNQYIFLKNKHA